MLRSGKEVKAGDLPSSPWLTPALVLYNLLYLVAFAAWSPWVIWRLVTRRSYRAGVSERLGRPLPREGSATATWVHGVSVGEIKAAMPLVEQLEAEHPGPEIILSATTPTGHGLARKVFAGKRIIYYPLDFWRLPAWSLGRIRPDLVLLMELELWPNFVEAARRRNCPVVVVNGRISARSFSRYTRVRHFLPQLSAITLYCMQNEEYAERIRRLGIPESRIRVTGNVKYDALAIKEQVAPDQEFSTILGRDEGRVVLAAGSTHGDEEEIIQRVVRRLRERTGRDIQLLLVPRHPERCATLAAAIRQGGECIERLTSIRAGSTGKTLPGSATLLVDTIGDLEKVYSVADLVFVGGSLMNRGGQNMLEPAAMAKPVLFGPNTWNFRADVKLLLDAEGAVQVGGEAELLERLAWYVDHPGEREELGRKGRAVIWGQKGATARTLREIEQAGLLP